jgi:hypothetical protein
VVVSFSVIDAAASDKSFEALWDEIKRLQQSGRVLGSFYGSTFSVSAVTPGSVCLDSHGIGLIEISRLALSWTYANWQIYRYQTLSPQNAQVTLYTVSLINHVVNIWVRREARDELVRLARASQPCDAAFWVVHYNAWGRYVGPKPVGESITLAEVFPDELPTVLSALESNATRLFHEVCTTAGDLWRKYPGYSPDVYQCVVGRNQICNR